MIRRFLQQLRRDPETLAFVFVWIGLTVVALIPVWHQRMLPMLDTPDHLALVRAWHDYHDASWHISDYYTLRVRLVPYIFFYWAIHMLMYVVSIETANKVFLSLYLITYPISILALARALGRSRWLALGGFALAFNPCWIYGFSSYLLGTVFLYFGWAQLIEYLDTERPRNLVGVFVFCLLAYLSHVMAWALFGLGALALLWLHRRQLVRVAYAAAAMVPTLFLAALAYVQEKHDHAYMNRGKHLHGVWKDAPDSLKEFPRRVLEIFPGNLDMWALFVITATVVLYLVWKNAPEATARARTRYLKALLWVMGVAYLMLPFTLDQPMSWWYVAARVPAIMAPLLLLLPSRSITRWEALAVVPMIAFTVAVTLRLTALYTDFNRRNIGFMRMIDELPRGARVLVLPRGLVSSGAEESGDPSSSAPVYWHFPSWPMALRGGFSAYLFNQGIPVQPHPGLPYFNVAKTDTFEFRAQPDFDYYIVHESSDPLRPDGSIRQMQTRSGWTLYKRVAAMTDEP